MKRNAKKTTSSVERLPAALFTMSREDLAAELRVIADSIEAHEDRAYSMLEKLSAETPPPFDFETWDPPKDYADRFASTEYVCKANADEQYSLWFEWHFVHGVDIEQEKAGASFTIGDTEIRWPGRKRFVTASIIATVFWWTVQGHRIAVPYMHSRFKDTHMFDAWILRAFPKQKRITNAANFGNILSDIENDMPIRSVEEVEDAVNRVPRRRGPERRAVAGKTTERRLERGG